MTRQLVRIGWLVTDPAREVYGRLHRPALTLEKRVLGACVRCGEDVRCTQDARWFSTRARGTAFRAVRDHYIHTRCIPEKDTQPGIPARARRRSA
jgi:hypothetical protein